MPKQNKVKLYAKALAEIALEERKGGSRASANFMALLAKNNLEKKAKEIVEQAEDIILEKQGKNKIVFETARKITAGQKKMLQDVSKEGDIVKEKINPELIAGIKIIINENKQFDASMAKKLQKIF
jgi:F0F1-type ATP synthase delta subunit